MAAQGRACYPIYYVPACCLKSFWQGFRRRCRRQHCHRSPQCPAGPPGPHQWSYAGGRACRQRTVRRNLKAARCALSAQASTCCGKESGMHGCVSGLTLEAEP
eukprot:1158708-Pelagomonas_calceolata.AAC.3